MYKVEDKNSILIKKSRSYKNVVEKIYAHSLLKAHFCGTSRLSSPHNILVYIYSPFPYYKIKMQWLHATYIVNTFSKKITLCYNYSAANLLFHSLMDAILLLLLYNLP